MDVNFVQCNRNSVIPVGVDLGRSVIGVDELAITTLKTVTALGLSRPLTSRGRAETILLAIANSACRLDERRCSRTRSCRIGRQRELKDRTVRHVRGYP